MRNEICIGDATIPMSPITLHDNPDAVRITVRLCHAIGSAAIVKHADDPCFLKVYGRFRSG
ncbi:hypothetical protein [Paraburkholderia caffeinilytica]|uniref:hypothetical protein n=1 Tax=Paraburkholderia caffeinilytica TaxID=1761016 RepID=UPI0013BEA4ED|nr:hypothetical protein [Paraburkholderia caffeinilytica]